MLCDHTRTGEKIRIEFEYRSSSFLPHRKEWKELKTADPSARWWLVCWHDDLDEKQKETLPELTIVALKGIARAHGQKLVLNWYDGGLDGPDVAEKMFDWRASALSEHHHQVIDRLKHFGQSEAGLNILWPLNPDLPKFTVCDVRRKIKCFGVYADGMISIGFSKWNGVPLRLRTKVIDRLNAALSTDWFTGREEKKKGRDAAQLLCNIDAIDPFLEVWRWLLHQPI